MWNAKPGISRNHQAERIQRYGKEALPQVTIWEGKKTVEEVKQRPK